MRPYDEALVIDLAAVSSNQRRTRSRWPEGRETNCEARAVIFFVRGLAKKGTRDQLSLTPVSKTGREMTIRTTISASGSKGPFSGCCADAGVGVFGNTTDWVGQV